MERTEFESVAIKDMDKCAMIYRSSSRIDPVSFIYVCYHCGANFTDIDRTLQHIESHFQVVHVTIDDKDVKSECNEGMDFENSSYNDLDTDNIPDITDPEIDIKAEVIKIEEDCADESVEKPNTTFHCERCDSGFSSKFSFRCHTLKEHFKQALECKKCGKTFKRDASIKNHLRQHIERGEVDWNCEGDGICEPSNGNVSVKCPEQREKTGSSMEVAMVEIQSENGPPKKKYKTAKASSKEKPRKSRAYICHKCSERYRTPNDLNDHLKEHSNSDMLQINKCKECKTHFQSAFDLRLHVLEIHLSVKKFQCSTCLIEFKKKESSLLEKHLQLHLANNTANWTNVCDGICDKEKDATKFEEITTTLEWSCELCSEKFYVKSNLNEHTRYMHSDNEQKLRCPQCETGFTKMKCYFAHQLEHRRVGGATVTETDMKVLIANFDSYIDEQLVMNAVENAPNSYKCLICDLEKSNQSEIRTHVRERHVYKSLPQPFIPTAKKKTERIPCTICGMAITRGSFRSHLKTHADGKKFQCSYCSRTFSKNYSRTTHERMHLGEKPFQCDECGKSFYSNSLLGAHKQVHDNKTYTCKICARVFKISSGYRRHMQTHRKDQTFECTICFKNFSTRVYLTRHIHKHNEKKFQCSFCESKFNTPKGKRIHEKCRHGYEPPI